MNSTISSPTVVGTELSGDQLVIHGRCNTKGSGIFLADINGFRCTRLKTNYILRSEDGIGRRSQLSNCIIDSIPLSRGFIKKRFKKIQDEDLEGKDTEETGEGAEDDEADVEGVVASAEEIETAGATDATQKEDQQETEKEAQKEAQKEGEASGNAADSIPQNAENVTAESTASGSEQRTEGTDATEAETTVLKSENSSEAVEDNAKDTENKKDQKEEYVQDFVTYEFDDGFAPESDTIPLPANQAGYSQDLGPR